MDCPIQQGLANGNPDVDAIYRLVLDLPQRFYGRRKVALGRGAWCPFNSQNTTWWKVAFPLLYLPACCSFRMTDIIRSFVAQRIAWENDWAILFHSPTVIQERNDHNILKDFIDEIPGYINNNHIKEALENTRIAGGTDNISMDLIHCYEALVRKDLIGRKELALLACWLNDLKQSTVQ